MKREDFACKCGCGFCQPHRRLIKGIRALERILGTEAVVESGCRCPVHNRDEDGGDSSSHLNAMAGDIWFGGMSIKTSMNDRAKIDKAIEESPFEFGGYHMYVDKGVIHVDVRGFRARW